MRFSKKYFVFALLLVLTLFWKLNNWSDRYAAVETFRGAELKDEVFYPMMSKNINDMVGLTVLLNDQSYTTKDSGVMLDTMMKPAASLDFIRDSMYGSTYRLDDKSAVLQTAGDVYEFLIGKSTATKNGDDYELAVAPTEYNGQVYLGIEDLCKIYGYDFSYDVSTQTISVAIEEYPRLPKKFDLRKSGKISKIRNQGSTSTCWACASLEAVESTLLPYENLIFSEADMIEKSGSSEEEDRGGEYTRALAYLLSWQGPVVDESESKSILDSIDSEAAQEKTVHLQEAHFFGAEDLDEIKWAVYRYGGVSTSIYASVSTSNLNTSSSYNKKTNAYCYMGTNKPNHDVVIVGWDDTYPASSFSQNVPGDGAFICQNSWGTGFGDNGIFYISYYDTNVGNQAVSYTKIDTANRYNYIYQSDLCGWLGQIGYNKNWCYGANVFTADGNQQIEAAGFYALKEGTEYQVYFVPEFENESSLGKRQLVAQGTLDDAGYYTIPFTKSYTVNEGQSFAVIVYLSSPGTMRPQAIEYQDTNMEVEVDITDGKGYISNNGLDWENIEEKSNANLCIKAYGNKIVEVFE